MKSTTGILLRKGISGRFELIIRGKVIFPNCLASNLFPNELKIGLEETKKNNKAIHLNIAPKICLPYN